MTVLSSMRFLLVIILFSANVFSQSIDLDELYVLYDTGETNVLRSLIKKSLKSGKKVKVLKFGTANRLLKTTNVNVDLFELLDIKIDNSINRRFQIPEAKIIKLLEVYNPRIVVTGLVSNVQNQISNAFKTKSTIFGIYDSFNSITKTHIANKFTLSLDEIWIPSELQKESFVEAGFSKIITVGHPTLGRWKSELSRKSRELLKFEKSLPKNKRILLYIGGYGNSYQKSLIHFLNSVKSRKDLSIYISLHPKVNGNVERVIIDEFTSLNAKILSKSISTAEASSVSDIIVTQNSTVGIQALAQNKEVLYFHTNKNYKNIAIVNNISPQLSSEIELNSYLDGNASIWSFDSKSLGIPEQPSVDIMFSRLTKQDN